MENVDQTPLATDQSRKGLLLLQLLLAFCCALGVRCYIWLKFPHVIFLHEADGIGYIGIARNILENGSIGAAAHFPPFYPAVIALFASLSGNYETGARLASVFAGSITVVPFQLACRCLIGDRGALYAALIAAMFGPFINYSVQPISQATYLALIVAGVWLAMKFAAGVQARYAVAFGLVSAAMYLTRPEGILFFAVNGPILLWSATRAKVPRKSKVQAAAALCIGFTLPVLLYMLKLRQLTGDWTLSGKSAVTIIGVDAAMKLLPDGKTYADSVAAGTGLSALVPSLWTLLKTCMGQAAKFAQASSGVLPMISLPVAVLGMLLICIAFFRAGGHERTSAFISRYLFFSPLLLLLPVFAFDKLSISMGYVFPFFPVYIACFAWGAVNLEKVVISGLCDALPRFSGSLRFLPLAAAAVACLMVFSFHQLHQELSSDEFRFMTEQQDFLLRQTGHWLRDSTGRDDRIMARWSNIGYYAERNWTGLVDGTIPQVVEYARRGKIKYIIIDSDAVPRRRPQLQDLLYPEIPQAGLRPVYARDQSYTRVVIYRVY